MRWVLLGRFGDAARQCAAFVMDRADVVAAVLEPAARSRAGWDEAGFRAAVRAWAHQQFREVRPVLGLQYVLARGGYETEWLLYCPVCGVGPFHLAARAGEAGLAPRTWDDRRLLCHLAEAFAHRHDLPDPHGPRAAGTTAGDAAAGQEPGLRGPATTVVGP
ncbi:hypothetical protein [Thermaerobacter composti]|uniref:Uncharacterized protein n=1 Tax=Thermaerobacter composti TaxID=554949 RepID=A0ABZ0QNX1_9FIRM|nr:hypothetical protein [Thermaerobacter composti]PZN01830.1 MAG: hypothetical protein DIU76_11155 [Bacillota bacterium]WPD19181.1 hypothetical protein Q5761_00435 [Thermaerobacter composti]